MGKLNLSLINNKKLMTKQLLKSILFSSLIFYIKTALKKYHIVLLEVLKV
jgi:hypothetical protein